jgi:hypothetical protein
MCLLATGKLSTSRARNLRQWWGKMKGRETDRQMNDRETQMERHRANEPVNMDPRFS